MMASGFATGLSQAEPEVSALRASIPDAGAVFTVKYPFVRGTYSDFDGNDCIEKPTWTPGVRHEWISPEDTAPVADAVGSMALTVVHAFKPGRFPWRVCFTRQFTNPDGNVFGKSKLHIVTLEKFRRLASGYRIPYDVGAPLDGISRPVQFARETFERLLAEARA